MRMNIPKYLFNPASFSPGTVNESAKSIEILLSRGSSSFFVVSLQLWALLHFIMPTLFDDHEEFNEWFSKDIESHAENKSHIDKSMILFLIRVLVCCGKVI